MLYIKFDGTAKGTTKMMNIENIEGYIPMVINYYYSRTQTPIVEGVHPTLWTTDGTTAGTKKIALGDWVFFSPFLGEEFELTLGRFTQY
ncbi:MAG: hypothetical protein ABIR06_14985 [Cyclobacteriaceae bacterium]